MGFVILALIVVGFATMVWYYTFTERGNRAAIERGRPAKEKKQAEIDEELRQKPGGKVHAPISEVARRDASGIACPKCGGTQFKARRTGAARAGITGAAVLTAGLGGLAGAAATKQKRVTCVTCGTRHMRG